MTDAPDPDRPHSQAFPGEGARQVASRTLRRSRDERVIAGVCGGLAEYLGVDPVLVRIAALLLVFAGGAGIVLYAIGWIAIPEEPEELVTAFEPASPPFAAERTSGALVLGMVFVALGVFFLVDAVWADFLSWKYVWPIALIAVGVAILLRPRR